MDYVMLCYICSDRQAAVRLLFWKGEFVVCALIDIEIAVLYCIVLACLLALSVSK